LALGVSAPVDVALAIGEGVALPVGVGGGVGGSVGGGAQEGSSEGEPLPDPVHEGIAERLAVGKAHAAAASRAPQNSRRDVRVRRHAARRSLATTQARQRKGGGARTKRRTVDLTACATKPRRSRSCTRAAARRAPRREEAKRPHGKAQARSMGGHARKSRGIRASMKIPVINISSTVGRGAQWSAENGAHLTIHAIQLPCATVRARRRRMDNCHFVHLARDQCTPRIDTTTNFYHEIFCKDLPTGTLNAYTKFELDCTMGGFQHSDTAMRHRVTNPHPYPGGFTLSLAL